MRLGGRACRSGGSAILHNIREFGPGRNDEIIRADDRDEETPPAKGKRIELWIGKTRHEPVRADLFVQSDKLAKQARFVVDPAAHPASVSEMVLVDQLSNKKETRIRYLARKERTVPGEWLNPMFLARNTTLE